MLLVVVSIVVLLILSTLIHYEALRGLSFALPRLSMPGRAKLVIAVLGTFGSHGLQVLLYAAAYHWLTWSHDAGMLGRSEMPTAVNSIYFSLTTYSSLGYGDVVPTGAIKLLAGTEALAGLLLIGWTAAYLYMTMERFWQLPADKATR